MKPKRPAVSLKIYKERLKKAQTTVKNRNTGKLARASEELINAKRVIKNPISTIGTILRNGNGTSMIIVAMRVENIMALIPCSKPINLAIKPAKTIKIIDLIADFHRGLPVGWESVLNLPMKPFFFNRTPHCCKLYFH